MARQCIMSPVFLYKQQQKIQNLLLSDGWWHEYLLSYEYPTKNIPYVIEIPKCRYLPSLGDGIKGTIIRLW